MADLDLSNDENSNGGGDNRDDDAENSTNQRDNDEDKLDPSRLENLLLDYSDYDLTDHHDSANGELAQLIKMKREARNSVWMTKDKAYLLGRLQCAALLEISLSASLECEVVLMAILTALVDPFLVETTI